MKYTCLFLALFLSLVSKAQISGCTDALAKNYNPSAIINDGSCKYDFAKVGPEFSIRLSDTISETSGLADFQGYLWTHNDDSDTKLYAIDSIGKIRKSHLLTGVKNTDWEEIAQDSSFFYIGNFGNNASGIRKDLQILRVSKASLLANEPLIDTISFSYSNQSNFIKAKSNATDFDCEAMVISSDSIYLFTKQWKAQKTTLYVLPKSPGTHTAQFKSELDVDGLITGAAYLEEKKLVVLCGYSKQLKPFLYLLYDFKGHDFFSGNKRKIKLTLLYHQMEGIATKDGLHYYITNEYFEIKPFVKVFQQLHRVDLSVFLRSYFENSEKLKH